MVKVRKRYRRETRLCDKVAVDVSVSGKDTVPVRREFLIAVDVVSVKLIRLTVRSKLLSSSKPLHSLP